LTFQLVTLGSFLVILVGTIKDPADIQMEKWGVVHIPGYSRWAGVTLWPDRYPAHESKIWPAAGAIEFLRASGAKGDFRFKLARSARKRGEFGGRTTAARPVEARGFPERFR